MIPVIQALQPEAQVPTELGPAQRLYRSCLDGKRVLLLFDNAANSAQVVPLMEWRSQTTFVIVTSRQAIAVPGLTNVSLGVMEPGEARDLLRVALSDRSATDDELDALSERCGRLPLALRVAGTFLALNRDWSVAEYIEAIADQTQRVAWLRIEDDARLDVHAVLGFSARKLAEDRPELFDGWRMLAVFPASFDRAAAAAVWSAEEDEARKGLGDLLRRNMVMYDKADGRYRLHDLMRDVARLPLEGEDEALVERRLEAAAARHAQYYRSVLGVADELYLKGDEDLLSGLALYDLEQRNIAAGQAWAVERIEICDDAARLAADYANAGVYVLGLRLTPRGRLGWLEAQIKACRRLGDRPGEGSALGNLGLAYADLGEMRRAIDFYQQALTIAREIGDRRHEGAALGNLGLAYAALDDPRRAIEYYEQDLVIACEIGDRRGEGNALGSLGRAYADLGEPRRAIQYFEEELAIARKMGDRRGEGAVLGNLGNAYAYLGEPRRAIGHYEQSLAIQRETGDRRGEGNALGNLGNAYADLGEPRRAIDHYERSLEIAREIGDRRGESSALGNLGLVYADLGEPRRAIEHYEQHLVIAREFADRGGEGNTLGNLGNAYAALGEPRRAIEYHLRALAISREIGDRRAEAQDLGNLGNAYTALGETRRAIEHYEEDLAIAREVGDRRGEGQALGNLGAAYADLGEPRRAIELYAQRLAIAREIGDQRGEGNALYGSALALKQLRQRAEAIRRMEEALRIYEQIESPQRRNARAKLAEWQGRGSG